jgi:hypothetical protein
MNKMTGQYGPVVFAHRAHAQMAEMSGGCYGCHHYNDTALKILACQNCHAAERKRETINVPDLKGAYHRQCMDCHRQWSGTAECTGCHLQEMKGKSASAILAGRVRKDHPAVPAPEKKVYPTKEQDGSLVTFFHSDHAGRFGLQCVDCHRQEGCVRCHDKRPASPGKPVPARADMDFETLHARCTACHAEEACASCHRKTESAAFDHGRAAGWPLKSYHARVACQRCHGATRKFTRVSSQCQSCHKPWNTETFRHEVTGFRLDAAHGMIECAECHAELNFSTTPSCTGCHDDKSWPQYKPGKVVSR